MNSNIAVMPINRIIESLSRIYIPMIKGNLPYESVPSAFIWGSPGVGKSDGVRQLGEIIENQTGKKVMVTDIRLLLFSPIDLRGVPVADETRTFTDWLMPRILDLNPGGDVVNILFLDELSAAPASVQAAAYQITLNRAIGEHRLPANTIVIAAGNRTTDRAVAYKMPSALANRMMHFEVSADFDSWKKWAINIGNIHPLVLGYLSSNLSKFISEDETFDNVAFCTPRSWAFVSNIINTVGDDDAIDDLYPVISGCIGAGVALEFISWCKVRSQIPDIRDILDGKTNIRPKSADCMYALIAALLAHVANAQKHEGMMARQIDNMCMYCSTFPADYLVSLYRDMINIEGMKLKLMKSSVFNDWINKNKKLISVLGMNE